jgi:hypothetical protein
MPTPSLKSASPWSTACKALDRLPSLTAAKTAMGSVGLIKAPNTKAHAIGSAMPPALAASQNPRPISVVETATPMVARLTIANPRFLSSARLTWDDPAKSRKANM